MDTSLDRRPAPLMGQADVGAWTEKLSMFWGQSFSRVRPPSHEALEQLAWHASVFIAPPSLPERAKLDQSARAAINTLLKWCRYDPNENGLPHMRVVDRRLLLLEEALIAAQPLAAPPAWAWASAAEAIWDEVSALVVNQGGNAGHNASAPAVKFTSLVMIWLGHADASANAVSMVLRRRSNATRA